MNKMKHILVCEDNEELIRKFSFEAIVVKTKNPEHVGHIGRVVEETNKVHCIELTIEDNLSGLNPLDDWKEVPLHIKAPRMGHFLDFVRVRHLLAPLSVRVFLNSGYEETYTDLQLMSSLGINCGLYFDENPINWKECTDLMDFVVYPKVPRATVEPFHYIITEYQPKETINFSGVYFNNPEKYLHIDKNENVALTAENLTAGKYLFNGVEQIQNIAENKAYKAYFQTWKKKFHKISACSACPAWRICGGFFENRLESNPGCREAFSELIDAADLHYNNKEKENEKQPQLCQL
jgi:radical SAM protein with 4Fe4S-binding SPASM domain